jgi:hypothetical protein
VGAAAYDAVGYQQVEHFEADHAEEPEAVWERWQEFQNWHPTRNWLRPQAARAESERLRQVEADARQHARDTQLAALSAHAADADADTLWQQFRQLQERFPEAPASAWASVEQALTAHRREQRAQQSRHIAAELEAAEQRGTDLEILLLRADQFLKSYADSAAATEVSRRRAAYIRRLDERDIEAAREYSARAPLQFQTRRGHYLHYLDKHPSGGAFTKEAETALRVIDSAWDRHDFRAIRDLYQEKPGDVAGLVARSRTYLAAHPQGRFQAAAADMLRWTERITAPGEYRVVLQNGGFDRDVARFFSRGPKLSVEVEVGGVRYGPSTICRNAYDPEWNFEFPRRIRWKLGDPVRVRVTEHSWKDRIVMDVASADDDPLAFRLLSGELWSGGNHLSFESDFSFPALPTIEESPTS